MPAVQDSHATCGQEDHAGVTRSAPAHHELESRSHCFIIIIWADAAGALKCGAGPTVQFADPGVAFGLVQLGKQVTQTVTIQNTSRYSSATWTLHALPQQASSAGASDSCYAAQLAQQAVETAYQGIPGALQAKQQQLLQQLQEAHVTAQSAASEADESTSIVVAAGVATATQPENPFEGLPAAEEEEEECGCRLLIEPECGVLAAGASASVQVTRCHCRSACRNGASHPCSNSALLPQQYTSSDVFCCMSYCPQLLPCLSPCSPLALPPSCPSPSPPPPRPPPPPSRPQALLAACDAVP